MPDLIPSDLDDTARLVLMEHPDASALEFGLRVRENAAGTVSATQAYVLWNRYVGSDPWTKPTHDIETGRRL